MGLLDKSLANWIENQDAKNADKVKFCDWTTGNDLTKAFCADRHGMALVERMESIKEHGTPLQKSIDAERLSQKKEAETLPQSVVEECVEKIDALAKGISGSERGLPLSVERTLNPTDADLQKAFATIKRLSKYGTDGKPLTPEQQIDVLLAQNRILRNLQRRK